MKTIFNKIRVASLPVLAALLLLTSCNKDLEQLAAIPTPVYPSGPGIAATLAANPNYSFYSAMITRAGLAATLNDTTKSFTLFATDNNGMKIFVNAASGGLVPLAAPDATFLGFISGTLPVASAQGIIQYNTVGGKFPAASIPTTFPNYPISSQIVLDPSLPFARLPIFPVRGTPYSYINNVPLIATDMAAGNGIIHTGFSIATPPSATLRSMIAAEPKLSFFREAVLRADSGQLVKPNNDSTNFLNYLLGYGVTNMTVLAPTDTAFKTIINALSGGAVPLSANDAVFIGFIRTALPVSQARGLIAYHFLASNTTPGNTTGTYKPDIRVFSVNVPATTTAIKTLVNASVAIHPGVFAQATYTGPVATSLKFTGAGNGGNASNAVSFDKHAVNGVYHIIDRVLLPQ